jgi:hypothetical protein
MIDGGSDVPSGKLDAWLLTDERCELRSRIRALARSAGLTPAVRAYEEDSLTIAPRRVVHTTRETWGYLIKTGRWKIVWAPEFLESRRGRGRPI